jgi:hypothetical protein
MTNTDDTALTTDVLNAVLRGAYAAWLWNGHDVVAALRVVAEHHMDPAVRAAASVPAGFVTETLQCEFAKWNEIERRAQGR